MRFMSKDGTLGFNNAHWIKTTNKLFITGVHRLFFNLMKVAKCKKHYKLKKVFCCLKKKKREKKTSVKNKCKKIAS